MSRSSDMASIDKFGDKLGRALWQFASEICVAFYSPSLFVAMLALTQAMVVSYAPSVTPVHTTRAAVTGAPRRTTRARSATTSEVALLGFWDPLSLTELNFWGQGDDFTVGFLRHAEIKHGRVAMAAVVRRRPCRCAPRASHSRRLPAAPSRRPRDFRPQPCSPPRPPPPQVGYMVQSFGVKFPWAPFDSIPAGIGPEATVGRAAGGGYQIVLFVGFLEVYSEHRFILEKEGQKHYCKGGKPGYFPTFDTMVHPCPLNLYDPFGWLGANMSEEERRSASPSRSTMGASRCSASWASSRTRTSRAPCRRRRRWRSTRAT